MFVSGCRSAAPQPTPNAPVERPPVAATPAPDATTAPPPAAAEPTTPPLSAEPETPPAATAPDTPAQPAEEAAADAAAPGDPAASQKEALELCQTAKDAAERGEFEKALTAADRAYELMLELPAGDTYLQAKEDIRLLVADVISRVYRTARAAAAPAAKPAASWDLGLGMLHNDHVQREIKSFTNGEREGFLEAYRRSGRYRPMMLAKLAEAGLPSQLSWLPLVESAFKVRALSRASALGLWTPRSPPTAPSAISPTSTRSSATGPRRWPRTTAARHA
jgi:membrane-bound lytic murein transglycosylase D